MKTSFEFNCFKSTLHIIIHSYKWIILLGYGERKNITNNPNPKYLFEKNKEIIPYIGTLNFILIATDECLDLRHIFPKNEI